MGICSVWLFFPLFSFPMEVSLWSQAGLRQKCRICDLLARTPASPILLLLRSKPSVRATQPGRAPRTCALAATHSGPCELLRYTEASVPGPVLHRLKLSSSSLRQALRTVPYTAATFALHCGLICVGKRWLPVTSWLGLFIGVTHLQSWAYWRLTEGDYWWRCNWPKRFNICVVGGGAALALEVACLCPSPSSAIFSWTTSGI